jgi:hypothetical protein
MAGAEEGGGAAVAHGFGGELDRGAWLATERGRCLLRHLDVLRRVEDFDVEGCDGWMAGEFALDGSAIANQQEPDLKMPRGDERSVNDGAGSIIAAHGVDGDTQTQATS